mmetsp:Transcript_77697/g.122661  ORF Transcript_77697/g.122661 Transcript_77697/m.122661 type:complete len:278 (-) Transcript_77697:1309-2142(-)
MLLNPSLQVLLGFASDLHLGVGQIVCIYLLSDFVLIGIHKVQRAACHSTANVHTESTKIDYCSPCHVFRKMIPDSFNHRDCTAISNTETLSGSSSEERSACSSSIHASVSCDRSVLSICRFFAFETMYLEYATRHTLGHIIVGFTMKSECHARHAICSERLTSSAMEIDSQFMPAAYKTLSTKSFCDFSGYASACSAICIDDFCRMRYFHWRNFFTSSCHKTRNISTRQQFIIECRAIRMDWLAPVRLDMLYGTFQEDTRIDILGLGNLAQSVLVNA